MMERLKRTFTFRRKKQTTLLDKGTKPSQWNDDERKVREGTCSFQVKYLSSIEVFESRGMPVCEEAMRQLLKYKSKKKSKRAVLYVSGDSLRVTEEISKGLIVDQVIEKVSFCAPDRNNRRGFAYICRDAATRRWLCHGFKAVKESGERLSHAVGCAFAVCLERKQQREKDSVDVTFNENKTSFTRLGSFKQATITERLQDPQSVIITDPIPTSSSVTTQSRDCNSSIPRPHASQSVLERQSSLRIFPKLQDQQKNPFKRDYSVRMADLSSNQERRQLWQTTGTIKEEGNNGLSHGTEAPVPRCNGAPQMSQIARPPVLVPTQEEDPFSVAPINRAAHIKQTNNIQALTQTKSGNYNMFQHSLRLPESSRSFNPVVQHGPKDTNNFTSVNKSDQSSLQFQTSNNDLLVSWNEDYLMSVARNNPSSYNNPFDVSWVGHANMPVSSSTNPFKC